MLLQGPRRYPATQVVLLMGMWRIAAAAADGGRRRLVLAASMALLALGLAAPAACASAAVTVSPLNGTPDASPRTQISFLGVPGDQIADVSVVGSSSGRHTGRLEAYDSSPGASFLPSRPFAQGEHVSVSAMVGPAGHRQRVGTTFTVAHPSNHPISSGSPLRLTKAGLEQSFVSAPALRPPVVSVGAASPNATPGDIFLTPTHGYGQTGMMIVNQQGRLVWFQAAPRNDTATNLQVQGYDGQPALTWWQGHVDNELGVGFGTDEIYSDTYTPLASVSAGNGYQADLHEFQLTPQGSAFITAYTLVDVNLSSLGGSADGILQDSVLQEIDVRTGLVMFEWHAYGHVALQDSFTRPSASGRPWDFFHLNSISLDPWGDGNFILSARNTWAAYEINHVSGAVMWRVGGTHPSFKMGPGTGFAWQHDVRWQPDHTLTMFDDGAAPAEHTQSRVIRERIDWKHDTVDLVGRIVHDPPLLAGSQGNDQVLGDGDQFVGWGEAPYFSEYGPSGEVLLDARIPYPGQSYRAYRFPWSATPAAPPSVAMKAAGAGATVYASWNGATEVSSWRVLGGASPGSLAPVASAAASGFETAIPVGGAYAYVAVQAVGGGGQVLGMSAVVRG